jgi:AraC-like DNA-binding protein
MELSAQSRLSPGPPTGAAGTGRRSAAGRVAKLQAAPERLMTVERAYRREGLTIGSLAALMSLPEYRLRQIINEGLGHRNFNAFLNRYRIDEAKASLTDSSQKEAPVLTIAMGAGFQCSVRSTAPSRLTPA